MKKLISTLGLVAVLLSGANAKSQLDYKVYRADAKSFNVASVLVTGEKEAVLLDAQFSKSDAHKVVAKILESKKELTTIYVSHGDPDYYFGLPVIKEAFPKAQIFASAETIKHIKKTYQKKLDFWGPKLGANGSDHVIIPKVLKGDVIKLEDNELQIKGLDKNAKRTYVWVPSLKAVFGGINVVNQIHAWMADASTSKARTAWLSVLNDMKKLNAEIVVPAHAKHGSKLDSSAIDFTINYISTYEKEVKKAKDSKELIASMVKAFPELNAKSFNLSLGAKVSKNEMKW